MSKQHIKWVKENLPALSFKGEEEIRKVVHQAEKSVSPIPSALSVCGGALGAFLGYMLSNAVVHDGMSRWEGLFFVVVGSGLATFLTSLIGNAIVHREIEAIVRGQQIN
jgi:hypothetical protein